MAGKISLTPEELLSQSQEMSSLCREFGSLFQKNQRILQQVNDNWSVNLARNFAGKITSAQRISSAITDMLDTGAKVAQSSAQAIKDVDQSLSNVIGGGDSSIKDASATSHVEKSIREGIWGTNSTTRFWDKITTEDGVHYFGKAVVGNTTSWDSNYKKKKKLVEQDDLYKDTKYLKGKEGDVDFYKKEGTIFSAGHSASASASLYEGSREFEHGSVYATVGKAEAHANAEAGFYSYTSDGKRIFSPGVSAEVGASVTVLAAGAEGQIGSDMLGVTGGVDLAAGKVAVKGTVELSAWEKGKGPQFNASASAEAIAAEAKASGKINVLGGGVEGSVGVNVGIGAHADIGIKNGVIKCDIGASIGVGVSANVEIDVGGMVNTAVENIDKITDAAGDAVEAVKDTAEAAWDAAEDFADAAADTAKDIAKGAGKAVKDAGKAVSDWWDGLF